MLVKHLDFGKNYNTRIQHVLEYNGIYTTEAVERMEDLHLLRLGNFSKESLRVLRSFIPRAGWQIWTPEMQAKEFEMERRA